MLRRIMKSVEMEGVLQLLFYHLLSLSALTSLAEGSKANKGLPD